jgi:hypothetical protein
VERGGKKWIAVQASRGEACIQASFTGWNLVLEGFLGGLVTGFGMCFGMCCFGKSLRFGQMTFLWLQSYRLQGLLGSYIWEIYDHYLRITGNNPSDPIQVESLKFSNCKIFSGKRHDPSCWLIFSMPGIYFCSFLSYFCTKHISVIGFLIE